MDKYKETNRAMAAENQKLRQNLALLKNEVLCLNRQLMAEQHNSRKFQRQLLNLVTQVSKSCNDAVQGLHEEIADLDDDGNKENRKSSAHRKTETLRRSIQLVQPICRQDQPKVSNDEEAPVEDIESRRQFIQVRRRIYNERSFDDDTERDLESRDTDESLLAMSTQFEEQEGYTPHLVSVIPEENTKDFTKSSESGQPGVSVISADDSTQPRLNNSLLISSDSNTGVESSVESFQESSSQSSQTVDDSDSLEEISESDPELYPASAHTVESSNELLGQPTLRRQNGTIHSTFMELTNLHGFSAVSLACSTPRKSLTVTETRDCYVRLKKLTSCDLIKWGVKTDEQITAKRTEKKNGNATRTRKKKRKSMSPKACQIRISVPRVSSPQVTTKCFPSFNADCSRPRRNAAPDNLQEPSLRGKMRRNK